MEQNQNTNLFALNIDPGGKSHLWEAARWAKFLSIAGFIICLIIILIGIFAGSFIELMGKRYGDYGNAEIDMSGFRTMIAIVYFLIALLYFFPCLFLFRFASYMKKALLSDNQENLNASFMNLKIMFRYVGIVTIVILAIYAIIFLFMIAGGIATGA